MSIASPKPVSFQLYNRRHYFEDLCQRIDATTAGSRVLITTMILDTNDTLVQQLVACLQKAAQREVIVYFATDAYDFVFDPHHILGPLWWHKQLPHHLSGHAKQAHAALQELRAAGVRCTVTNVPTHRLSNPFAGRSHIKMAVINDYVYVGGCNLEHAEQIDCMVGWRDITCADWLFGKGKALVTKGTSSQAFGDQDLACAVDGHSQLLLDVGVPKQSIILDTALQAIDRAHRWIVLSCQYFPGGVTAEHLVQAQLRDVHVYLLLNHIAQQQHVNKIIQRVMTPLERRKVPHAFFDFTIDRTLPYLHAKIIATDQEALVGSHNYVAAGVNFGTAELALHCQDTLFAQQLAQSVVRQTNFAHDTRFTFLNAPNDQRVVR